jgi:hypothetical protein
MNTEMIKVYYTLLRPPESCPIPKGEEDIMCIKFANHLRAWTIEGKLKAVWFHPANETGDNTKFHFGNKLRAMGKIPGVPDYVFATKDRSYFMEFKSKKGKQSDSQKAFENWCIEQDVPYALVRTFEEAENKLKEWGILKC